MKRPQPQNPQKHMSFLDHLEEFRWHLIRSVAVLVVLMVVMFIYRDFLVQQIVLGPLQPDFFTNQFFCQLTPSACNSQGLKVTLQATDPAEQFTKAILIAVVAALVVAFPYLCWELWRFIKPGLLLKEKLHTRGIVFTVSSLFLIGVLFGYFIISPATLTFFATFQLAPQVQNIWRVGEVISLIVQLSLAGGLLFELPVAAYVLANIGILTPKPMRHYRRHAVVVIIFVAGVLTPSPDLVSNLLLGIPLYLLYELSIVIVARVAKRRQAAEPTVLAAEYVPSDEQPKLPTAAPLDQYVD